MINRTFTALCFAICIASCIETTDQTGSTSQEVEVVCNLPGDRDGDGVPDYYPNLQPWDVSQTDSCLSDPYGIGTTSQATGAGDGFPDCE